ncbi:hypothetical protein [Tsukamurella sp. NPDC003166]|uniref:phage holin n=1 Tax=Tsukamurella sp. NPDC003166 TaxID=3154444 RepID=UPI0033A2664E
MDSDSDDRSPTVFGIRTWQDVRIFLHATAPAASPLLLTVSTFSDRAAQLITAVCALIVAVTDSSVSALKSPERLRYWIYPVLTALGSVIVVAGLVTEHQWAILVASAPIVLGGTAARANALESSVRSRNPESGYPAEQSDDPSNSDIE